MIERFLHFLKEFPPWVVLAALAVFLLFRFSPDDPRFYERITDAVLVSLFTALGVRARLTEVKNDNNFDGANLNTPALNPSEMNNTTVNVQKESE